MEPAGRGRVERRLAAILAADVAGYSRLMGADEEGTHERLKAHLQELVDPKINEHRGRIVKNTGDGFLVEFASVVDAVRCAVAVQHGMIEREPELPEISRIRFRIGINLGDVIVEEHDIFGDGVNIAASSRSHGRARRHLHLVRGADPNPRQARFSGRGPRCPGAEKHRPAVPCVARRSAAVSPACRSGIGDGRARCLAIA
jgi:hypothetical protein